MPLPTTVKKEVRPAKNGSILRHSLESFPLYFPSKALNEAGSCMEKNPAWSTFSCVEPQQPQQLGRADGRGFSPQLWQLIVWISSPFTQKRSWNVDSNLFWLGDEELWWKTAGSLENLIFHWECFLVYTESWRPNLISILGFRSPCPNLQMLLQPLILHPSF